MIACHSTRWCLVQAGMMCGQKRRKEKHSRDHVQVKAVSNSHENCIKAQLVHHWAPSRRGRIDLTESHHGIKGRQSKIEILPPSRPIQRVIWVAGRAWLQDDLGLGGVPTSPEQFLEANRPGRPCRFIGPVLSPHDCSVTQGISRTILQRKRAAIMSYNSPSQYRPMTAYISEVPS